MAAEPVINMYSEATTDAEVVSQAIYGTTVEQITPKDNAQAPDGWIYIKTSDDYPGWVRRDQFLPLHDHDYAGPGKHVVTVTNRAANVYRETDVTKHAPVLVLPFETALEETVTEGSRWIKVRLVDGKEVWVQAGDVQERASRPLTIDETIALAKKFLGVTYTWGGRSSFGYDCSGFTQMLMRQHGVLMPRDADVQAAWSGVVAVERKDLKPGDLLFFGSSPSHITHTGMYIGNGQFIHDTTHSHPMVQISTLDDQPWTKLLVACRRPK
ncbi:MAG TPA: C40 family peptidase [Terriglobales bacterium]|nr:C40 family peptidase [Terriglobales bacterium]